jgi:hypothetical protein
MRFLALILACTAAAYALAFAIAVPGNPEVKFWRAVDQRRNQEIAAVRQADPAPPLLLFTGGSSCAFSIDPEIIEASCGHPAFNLGLPVAAGAKFLLHQALAKARPGDTLVVCLEPDLLTFPGDFKPGTFSFGLATLNGDPSAAVGGTSFDRELTLRDCLNLSRPGPSHLATLIGKTAAGKGLYRYTRDDLRYRGRVETSVREPGLPRSGTKTADQLLPAARDLLTTFRQAADRKGVHLAYSMPWMLTAESAAAANRAANRRILDAIDPILPVLDDGWLGVSTDPAHFSDSGLHLTAEGSRLRSAGLSKALDLWLKR